MPHFASLYPDNSRFEEIEKIITFIKEGNSCQILGLPGVGKSNLCNLLAYNKNVRIKHLGDNQKWFHFVLLNFSEVRGRPLIDVIKFIFLGIIDSLRERDLDEEYQKVDQIFKESLPYQDELVLFQSLKKAIDYLSLEKELTVVLLFDRFEEYIPTITPQFFANLRILRNRAKFRFSIVLSTHRPIEDSVEPAIFTDYYEFLVSHNVYLPLFDKPGLDFRIAHKEKTTEQKIDKKLRETIMNLTAGHGKLTRLCLDIALADKETKEFTQEYFLSKKVIQGGLLEIWQFLSPEEQKIFASEAKKETYHIQNQFLENINLIKNGTITIPLFESFIRSNETTTTATEKIIYDPNTNTITKGETIISERLTGSEFRLLRIMAENPDKVIEKDELIKTVWQDNKQTLGVTDQALDQLIFRLRKKIEQDPNNPSHIHTIKGRGYKFEA